MTKIIYSIVSGRDRLEIGAMSRAEALHKLATYKRTNRRAARLDEEHQEIGERKQ